MRTLSAESSNPFVVHDKEVDIVRFAINSGFADIVLDGQVALRVMYQRPGETEVRAQTLTYYDTDGLHNYYDWQLAQSDLAKNGSLMVALCILDISGGEVSEWHTTPCAVRVLSTIHTDDSDEGDDTITPTVKERVAVLETMIQRVASGAPIVVASTSAMTDTAQIYVLSTDGNWYYHNGSTWVAGGVYGAVATDTTLTQTGAAADAKAVGDEIVKLKADLKSAVDNLLYLSIDESEFIAKKYIWSDGKIYSSSTYTLSPYIRCAFRKIKFNCLTEGSGIQCIAFYSEENEAAFLGGYENTVSLSTFPQHEMDVPDGTMYIRISKNAISAYVANVTPWIMSTESGESVAERIDESDATATEALHKVENIDPSDILSSVYRSVYSDVNLIPSDGMIEHSYVNDSGEIKTTTNTGASIYNFVLSGYIPVEQGKMLYLSGDDFFYNRYFAWYDADKNYIGGNSLSGSMVFTAHVAFAIVPNSAAYLRITFRTAENADVAWAGYTGTAPTGEVIKATNAEYLDYHYYPENPCDFIGRDVCTFNKILCIGDSITAGYFNHSGGGQTISKYSYPAHLKKITGVDCVNMGDSGRTSVSWWNTYQNDDFSGYDCAIINLGINDALLSVTEEDTRAAFTNIINALKTANTGIKIFIANVIPAYARGNTTYDAINAIIEDIATSTDNCYFIDLTQYGHAVGVAYVNGHLTAAGYWMLAEDYANAISYIIRNNPESFRFIQFIGTDMHN